MCVSVFQLLIILLLLKHSPCSQGVPLANPGLCELMYVEGDRLCVILNVCYAADVGVTGALEESGDGPHLALIQLCALVQFCSSAKPPAHLIYILLVSWFRVKSVQVRRVSVISEPRRGGEHTGVLCKCTQHCTNEPNLNRMMGVWGLMVVCFVLCFIWTLFVQGFCFFFFLVAFRLELYVQF